MNGVIFNNQRNQTKLDVETDKLEFVDLNH